MSFLSDDKLGVNTLQAAADRPVVAIVANRYSDFRRPMIDSMAAQLDAAGYGTICVLGGELQPLSGPHNTTLKACNGIYSVAANYPVVGYIVISVTLGYLPPADEVVAAIRQFGDKPAISFGLDIPGMPSIVLNNATSMHTLMQHMTADPDRRQFVFMRGFPNMPDSMQRERAFRDVLAEKNIPVDEELIITGNFLRPDAYTAMDTLLQTRQDFDAVVAASDIMAVSAIHALNAHGLRVPDDVVVSGFDDRPIAAECSPTLTSVGYSFASRATAAVDHLLLQISDAQTRLQNPRQCFVDGALVVRDSTNACSDRSAISNSAAVTFKPEAFRRRLRSSVATACTPESVNVDQLIDEILQSIQSERATDHPYLLTCLEDVHKQHGTTRWWQNYSQQLNTELGKPDCQDLSSCALMQVSNMQAAIQRTVWTVNGKQQFENLKYLQLQDFLHIKLASCTDIEGVRDVLIKSFEQMGIRRAHIALYDTYSAVPDRVARLVLSHPCDPTADNASYPFDASQLLPEALLDELSAGLFVQTPLCSGEYHYGYLLIDPSDVAPLNIENLANSISLAVSNCKRILSLQQQSQELRRSNEKLAQLANIDQLTSLANRNRFQTSLQTAFHQANDQATEVGLLYFDLDGFKLVNDSMGHSAGDQLLAIVAKRLRRLLRREDLAARIGGDEFTVILQDLPNREHPAKMAQRILEALREPYALGSHSVKLTASIGIALYPQHATSAETLVQHADTAMYHAKSLGKNQFAYYHSTLNEEVALHLRLDQAMRDGLSNNEFSMYYQPRVELNTGEVLGVEALMRWHPSVELPNASCHQPDQFICIAEQSGFINQLDDFALNEACKQATEWDSIGMPTKVSVNMSVMVLQQPAIVETIESTLKRHNTNPSLLELEVTESAAMTDVEGNIEKLAALRDLGLSISIDDFGTGYSSLNYLKRLPITSLKIDRSFLIEITENNPQQTADESIVATIVGLGRSMGFRLIAEGVENIAQQSFLMSLGCDEAQGFLFGMPMDAVSSTRFLLATRQQHSEIATLRTVNQPI